MQDLAPRAPESQSVESLLFSGLVQPTVGDLIDFGGFDDVFQNPAEYLGANTYANFNPDIQLIPEFRYSSHELFDTTSMSSSASDAGAPILTPRSSHESLTRADALNSEYDHFFKLTANPNTCAPIIYPPASIQKTDGEKKKKYLLRVARKPALPKGMSSETSSSKKFYFDDMDEFDSNFENWMKVQFFNPGFCWGLWELENPERQERLSSTKAVIDELEFIWSAYRSNEAALYLVAKSVDEMGWGGDGPF
ncbi:hypothetical protein TWF481_010794 [Arthrobotrys musiformis]|uniref:Uncharacterized protein n=1 Tax=Arthrobotrys musiformis TaxID=47236 RepID=A0AAV9W3Y7_9PEZI